MPKSNRPAQQHPEACVSVPTESPVPGVNIELASLLVQAIKARRKFSSKSSLAEVDNGEKETLRQGMLHDLRSVADDKTATFLNELRRRVEHSSASVSRTSSRKNTTKRSSNAPTLCLEFLLEILSDGSNNSIHLRISSLKLAREILERSSDSRSFFASGRCLLDFIAVVEGIESDHVEEEAHNETSTNTSNMLPKSIFQLEAMELIHYLASNFGGFYTQFTVASRLLGDVSVSLSMHNTIQISNSYGVREGGKHHSQRVNMNILRRERDIALDCGPKACQSLGRMAERTDGYFRVLVPRFGGFNTEPLDLLNKKDNNQVLDEMAEIGATGDSKPAVESNGLDPKINMNGVDHDGDNDDDSIDWEEGDIGLSDSENFNEKTHDTYSDLLSNEPNDHQAAVEQTMHVMGRGGALLDGNLAVQVGVKSMETKVTPIRKEAETLGDPATATTSQLAGTHTEARLKLQNVVEKFCSCRLPRLNRWIYALSHADGMKERAVVDPATAAIPGNEGPVSLVLLSEEKRTMRSQLLQRMIKMRGEIEGVLRSAATLGIFPEGADKKKDTDGSKGRVLKQNEDKQTPVNGTDQKNHVDTGMKRPWMPGRTKTLVVASKKRKPKTSRFKVIYRENPKF